MSVPAFKNSRSKVRRRRSHHALKPVQLVKDKVTGEYVLPHHATEAAPVSPAPKKAVKKAVKAEKAPKAPKAKAKEVKEAKKVEEEKK